jgi:flagellar hook-associated protein 1 FlgK
MADILKIGLSALLAQQRALATTSNNIANASTPGYSRQRVEYTERPMQRLGDDMVGTGVQITSIRRITDDIIADQLRAASGGFHRSEAFAGLAESLDNLLADGNTGLSVTLQALANALQDLANDPASTAARQAFVSEARNAVSRFDAMDRRLAEIGNEAQSRLSATTGRINTLGAGLAEINRQILNAGVATGRSTPNDLMDQRDRLLEELAQLVRVDTAQQEDGTTSVFIGSGQVLVLGTTSAELAVAPGDFDPAQPRIVLRGSGPDMDITRSLTGGELGGLLDFNREMLAPARSELGRIAVGLAAQLNTAHRDGMDLYGQLGGDLFSIAAPQSFAATTNTGTGTQTVAIADVSALQPTSYQLSYNGASYSLLRADNGASVTMTGTGTVADPFVADGLTIVVGGAPAAGDQFLIKPLEHVAGTLQLLVTDPARVAAASPTRTRSALANVGDGTISAGQVVDVTNANLLNVATIEFINATQYQINGAGTFAYTPGADIVVNGTRAQISGAPAAGDRFVIEANAGGVGDNRNALELVDALRSGVLDGGNVTLQGATSNLITGIGARTAESSNQRDAQGLVLDQMRERLESVRGVNLDEEAADMLRFEQIYHAAAQTMAVADSLFNSLLAAIRR